jgi:hypothetical protein
MASHLILAPLTVLIITTAIYFRRLTGTTVCIIITVTTVNIPVDLLSAWFLVITDKSCLDSYSTPFVNSQAYWTNSKATAITSGLYIDYLLRGGLGLHAEAGYRYWNLHNKFDSRNLNTQGPPTSNGGYDISQTNYNQNVYYMQLGMKKELFHKNGFHLHAGLNALILLRNNMNCESTDYSYDATGAGFSGTHTSYTGDDAYALGLNGSLGFDIHLFRNFFAGADITQAYMYTNIYGNETDQVDFLYSPRPSIVYRYPEGIQRFAFSSVCFAFHLGLRL